jgi:NAD(P)H-hydrate epimerase
MPAPVLSLAEMRAWERATWAAGRTETEVISRVGHIVAHRARQMTRAGDTVLILAGKGHNGDDARQAAQHLSDRELVALNVTKPAKTLTEISWVGDLSPSLIIDGLFGIGLNRRLSPAWVRLVERVNASGVQVLAVDVPSGLEADSGRPLGAAVKATVTLTLGAPKVGLLKRCAADYVGRLEVAPDIGLTKPPSPSLAWWTLPDDFAHYPPARLAASHKGCFGHVLLVAGSLGYHGAAVLMARAAQRAWPGLVTLWTLPETYLPTASQLQAVMVHPWTPELELPSGITAVGVGPGLAAPLPEALKGQLRRWWRQLDRPMLADASALDWLGPAKRKGGGPLRVITPHPGEAARLLGRPPEAVQADRPAAVRALARQLPQGWVVLKGQHTLITQERGPLWVNSSGNTGLAQGGSGDVLAGFLAGLLAQPALQADPGQLLRYGVWAHGQAADQLSARRGSWTVEDLVEAMSLNWG